MPCACLLLLAPASPLEAPSGVAKNGQMHLTMSVSSRSLPGMQADSPSPPQPVELPDASDTSFLEAHLLSDFNLAFEHVKNERVSPSA